MSLLQDKQKEKPVPVSQLKERTHWQKREARTASVISIPKCLSGEKKGLIHMHESESQNWVLSQKNHTKQIKSKSVRTLGYWEKFCDDPSVRDTRLHKHPPNKPIFKPKIWARLVTFELFQILSQLAKLVVMILDHSSFTESKTIWAIISRLKAEALLILLHQWEKCLEQCLSTLFEPWHAVYTGKVLRHTTNVTK